MNSAQRTTLKDIVRIIKNTFELPTSPIDPEMEGIVKENNAVKNEISTLCWEVKDSDYYSPINRIHRIVMKCEDATEKAVYGRFPAAQKVNDALNEVYSVCVTALQG
jgi:hypothetical protein